MDAGEGDLAGEPAGELAPAGVEVGGGATLEHELELDRVCGDDHEPSGSSSGSRYQLITRAARIASAVESVTVPLSFVILTLPSGWDETTKRGSRMR
jgi:hypothetical protein